METDIAKGRYGPRPVQDWSVAEALEMAVGETRVIAYTRRVYRGIARQFVAWLGERYPIVRRWADLETIHVQEYLNSLYSAGRSNATIRYHTFIVRWTARRMEALFPGIYRDVTKGVLIPRKKQNPFEARKRRENKVLPRDVFFDFLSFVAVRRPALYGPLVCQALAGMRVLEAVNLRPCDIGVDGTVTITETPTHRPKTDSSFRQIPVADVVLRHLQRAAEGKRPDEVLFRPRSGGMWQSATYSIAMRRLFREYAKLGRFDMTEYEPRFFRANFTSLALAADISDRVVRRYLGHTPRDIMGLHYEVIGLDRLADVARFVNELCHNSGTQDELELIVGGQTRG